MSKNGVPYGGILLTAVIGLFGVVLNAVTPSEAFEIVLNIAAVGVLAAWGTIVACQLRLYRMVKAGNAAAADASGCRWRPYSGYVTLAFLAGVLVLMALDPEKGPLGHRGTGGRGPRPDRRLVSGPQPRARRGRTRRAHRGRSGTGAGVIEQTLCYCSRGAPPTRLRTGPGSGRRRVVDRDIRARRGHHPRDQRRRRRFQRRALPHVRVARGSDGPRLAAGRATVPRRPERPGRRRPCRRRAAGTDRCGGRRRRCAGGIRRAASGLLESAVGGIPRGVAGLGSAGRCRRRAAAICTDCWSA